MNPYANPFAPGAGSQPPELVGRNVILEKAAIALGRIRAGRHDKSMVLVGLRGVGKTVLLNRMYDRAISAGFRVAFIEAHEAKSLPLLLIPQIRQILYGLDIAKNVSEKTKRAFRVLRSFLGVIKTKFGGVEISLGVEPELGSADSGDLEVDLPDLFFALGEAAAERETAVAIFIDELQYVVDAEMSALIMAAHKLSQRNLPVVIIGAGLPQVVALAGRSKSYAERLFDYPEVGPLARYDAHNALQVPVRFQNAKFTEEALDKIFEVTQGYPYFLQQWGHEAWNLSESTTIGIEVVVEATKQAIAKLDQSFFRVRFDRLTPREKEYMRALAGLGEGNQRSGEIAAALQVKPQSIAPIRSSIIKKGMIYSPAFGDTAFTVPLFGDFLLRSIPDEP
jgi:hypothetical protein